jgi:CheY-like chemotaxis protein
MSKVEVVVVEDELSSMAVITAKLDKAGLTYITVNESVDAMEAAIKYRPDLAILDYYMPEVDGITLCNQLNRDPRTSGIDIIFLSADEDIEQHLKTAKVKYVSAHNKGDPVIEVVMAALARRLQKQCEASISVFKQANQEIIEQLAH